MVDWALSERALRAEGVATQAEYGRPPVLTPAMEDSLEAVAGGQKAPFRTEDVPT